MISWKYKVAVVGATLLLPACAFTEEALWPSLTGEDPAGGNAQQTQQQAAAPGTVQAVPGAAPVGAAAGVQPPLGTTNFAPPGVTPGQETGTFVGKKAVELRGELNRLQASIGQHNGVLQQLRAKIVQDSQRYHTTVGAINARLQVGTTPGNPILVQQFNSSQADLDRLAADIAEMNGLATNVAGSSTMSAYLSESARAAFGISGAVDEDHRQLTILEDEVNRTVVLIDRLLKEVADDVRRQTNYVATERSNLNLLSAGIKSGEIYGASLVNRAMVSVAGKGSGVVRSGARAADITGRRPLVVIRFDKPNVPFQQAVYNAVSRVLERRPAATFDLVAVAPAAGGPARVAVNTNKSRRYAESVLRSLVEMGLPPGRVAIAGTTSGGAKSNEVHIYLR
ncbi:MAG: hypothetical protein HN403_01065 [Rhodospirillales bacterium]|jgi:hypothetical protein|nr:hypothetical protein [Rhodospirillales bacterium]